MPLLQYILRRNPRWGVFQILSQILISAEFGLQLIETGLETLLLARVGVEDIRVDHESVLVGTHTRCRPISSSGVFRTRHEVRVRQVLPKLLLLSVSTG
jgi:hypothetical protein